MKKLTLILLTIFFFCSNAWADGTGLRQLKLIDIDETEEEVKSGTSSLFGWYLFNAGAAVRYFKFYNGTASSVIVGTTTPVLTIPVPAGGGSNVIISGLSDFNNGILYTTGITVACTTGVADSDTGAPGANECIGNFFYR